MRKKRNDRESNLEVFFHPENRKNFLLFYRFLSRPGQGMALCNIYPEERLKLFRFFRSDDLKDRIRCIDMANPLCTPLELQQTIIRLNDNQPREKKIFFIYNMESCFFMMQSTEGDFFQRLNLIRDFFMRFQSIFVFFVTDYSIKEMICHTFDFYDWLKHIFTFEGEKEVRKEGVILQTIAPPGDGVGKYSNPTEKIAYLKSSLEIITDEREKAEGLFKLAQLYHQVGQYDTALERFLESLNIEKRYGESQKVALINTLIATIYQEKGDIKQAMRFALDALKIAKAANDQVNTAIAHNTISELYHSNGDHEKAGTYYEQALEMWRKVYGDQHPNIAISLNNLGTALFQMGRKHKALTYFEKAHAMFYSLFGPDHEYTQLTAEHIKDCK